MEIKQICTVTDWHYRKICPLKCHFFSFKACNLQNCNSGEAPHSGRHSININEYMKNVQTKVIRLLYLHATSSRKENMESQHNSRPMVSKNHVPLWPESPEGVTNNILHPEYQGMALQEPGAYQQSLPEEILSSQKKYRPVLILWIQK